MTMIAYTFLKPITDPRREKKPPPQLAVRPPTASSNSTSNAAMPALAKMD
jgi:hypothetical protein